MTLNSPRTPQRLIFFCYLDPDTQGSALWEASCLRIRMEADVDQGYQSALHPTWIHNTDF